MTDLRYGSVCSGIEAATVAWHPLGWKPSFYSEIDTAPRKLLQHHYPAVPLHGDFTTIKGGDYESIDLLVGGTPCQEFSVAGPRGGLSSERGNLALEFILLAERLRPKLLLWENVAGVLSSNKGRDFGSLLGAMGKLGYGFAYRVLNSEYFGVPQRRRRVFLVGFSGSWRSAAKILFEPESLQGDIAPLSGEQSVRGRDKTTFGCFDTRGVNAYDRADLDNLLFFDPKGPRRPTPVEVERAFGFPDNYTLLEGISESARYKMLGNSMAVPVMKWLGQRIQLVLEAA